jgi:hemerythrin-like domain-containing protein
MDTKPTAVLEREHGHIQSVIAALVRHEAAIEAGDAPDLDLLERVVDFLRAYADRCHHGKEEAILFPLLEQRGVPATGCPLGALKHDHIDGRAHVADLANAVADSRAGRTVAPDVFLDVLRRITGLYPGHIWKEDFLLFPMTGKVLTEADLVDLSRLFEEADHDTGWAVIRRAEAFAEGLTE